MNSEDGKQLPKRGRKKSNLKTKKQKYLYNYINISPSSHSHLTNLVRGTP